MLGRLIFNKLGIAVKEVMTGAGLVAVTAATGLVVYNVMSNNSSSNSINTAPDSGVYNNVQYGSGAQIGSGGITTESIAAAGKAAGRSGFTVGNPPPAPNTPAAGVTAASGESGASPDQGGTGAANAGLLQGIGDQAKAQKQAQAELFGTINQQLANAQTGAAEAQAAAAAKLKNYGDLSGLKGSSRPGGNLNYNPAQVSGGSGAGGSDSASAAQRLASAQMKNAQAPGQANRGRITGMGGTNSNVNATGAAYNPASKEIDGAGAQANQIRKALADAGSKDNLASTVIGDIYQNAGTSSGGIELTGPSAISGDGSSGLTVGQVAQANKNQKAAKETVDVAKAQAELRKARTNRAWAIFALAVAGGLALSAVLAYAGGMAHTPFTKAAVVAAAIIGAAAIGFAMYQVLKNYGDGVNISGGLKAFMGVTMGLTAGLVLMSALVPSVAKFINTKITVHVLKFLHTTLGGLIGTTAATSVAQTSYSQIKQGDAAKGTYDATVNASNQKVK